MTLLPGRWDDLVRRRRVEIAWAAFAGMNYAAMIAWPSWETIPFHFVWISLTLLYGFRVWDIRPTLIVLACVMVMTGFSIGLDAFHGVQLWGELFEVPLMAAMFLAMVWHARRRVDAQRIAEGRAEEHRSLLERQERFIHDASHELRTPLTIARGHLELLQSATETQPEVEVALDELGRMDAIVARLLVLAVADEPDFLQTADIELEPLLEDVFMRWSGLAPRAWRLGPLASGRLHVDADRLRAALDALLENAVKYSPPGAAIELRATSAGTRRGGDRGRGRGLRGAAGGAVADLRSLRAGRLGAHARRGRRRARPGHHRRHRQSSWRQLQRDQHRCRVDLRAAPARFHPRARARAS